MVKGEKLLLESYYVMKKMPPVLPGLFRIFRKGKASIPVIKSRKRPGLIFQNIPVTKKNNPIHEIPKLINQRNLLFVRIAIAEMAIEIWNNVTALARIS
jgi:hypothetical protein